MRRMGVSLDRRLTGATGHPPARLRPSAFERDLAGLRERVERRIALDVEEAAARFALDRFLYEIEVEAMGRWLRGLVAFDAYCARRAQPGGRDKPK